MAKSIIGRKMTFIKVKSQHSQTIYQRSFSAVPEKVSIFTE
jgi:hypothetical protein